MNNITPVVKQLLIINIIFFIGSQILGDRADQLFALFSFANPLFKPYQLITHMFMHGGVAHILFNMIALVSFGSALEHFWGGKRFLFFYISCGLGAALVNNLVNQYYFHDIVSAAVGASGAVYGLLVAFAFMFPNAELALMFIPVPIKAKYFVPILVGLDLFSGFTGFSIFGGGIAHFAHVGGAVVGFIMMWFWRNNKFNQNRWN